MARHSNVPIESFWYPFFFPFILWWPKLLAFMAMMYIYIHDMQHYIPVLYAVTPHNRLVDKIYIKENFCRKMYAALLYFSSIFMMGDSFLFDSSQWTSFGVAWCMWWWDMWMTASPGVLLCYGYGVGGRRLL